MHSLSIEKSTPGRHFDGQAAQYTWNDAIHNPLLQHFEMGCSPASLTSPLECVGCSNLERTRSLGFRDLPDEPDLWFKGGQVRTSRGQRTPVASTSHLTPHSLLSRVFPFKLPNRWNIPMR